MSGANGFGRFFGGSASEIPPMARPPAPPPDTDQSAPVAHPIPFRTGRIVDPPPSRVEEPVEVAEVTEAPEAPVVEEVVEEVAEVQEVEQVAEVAEIVPEP